MLELVDLCKRFDRDHACVKAALEPLTLTIQAESFTVVAGNERSGKTTLQNLIAGRIRPDGGIIRLNGMDITEWPEYRRARYIGHVFHNPSAGTPSALTVMESLALALPDRLAGMARPLLHQKRRRQLLAMLESADFGLAEVAGLPVTKLSCGQRQALTILMAVVRRPRLLLLDEYTSGLNARESELVTRFTIRLIEEYRPAVLMVTDSMQQAVRFGERLLLLFNGRIILDAGGGVQKAALFRRPPRAPQ